MNKNKTKKLLANFILEFNSEVKNRINTTLSKMKSALKLGIILI